MKNKLIALTSVLIPAVVGGFLTFGCDDVAKEACGECGLVAEGDIGISGNAKLDGFFKAVADLNGAVAKVNGSFETELAALEEAFGIVDASGDLSARVDGLVLAIQGEVNANVQGGLTVNYAPPKCSANVSVTLEAQAQCEAKADCEVTVDPGSAEVTCEGSCSGSCSGGCEGEAQCKVAISGGQCSGSCEGSCQMDVAAKCDGTCRGTCTGNCSAYNGSGECAGACDGNCQGSCELNAAAECSGSCTGSCTAPSGDVECSGEVKCEGSCTGSCSGGCEGSVEPPSAEGSCEASGECSAQAKAQGSANVECTPPSLDVGFEFKAGLDANAKAAFGAKLVALKAHGAVMLQSFVKYQALITGEVNGEVVFDPAPVVSITSGLQGVIQGGVDGSLFADIPKGRITCVIPAMEASVTMLGEITSEATANLQAQAAFATAFTSGFSG